MSSIFGRLRQRPLSAATILLLFLTLIFLGKVLVPPDGWAIGAHDMRGQFYPWLTYTVSELQDGRLPLWDPYEFSGYPFISNPQIGLFYPPTWLAFILPVNVGISWYVALHILLAALGMYSYVRFIKGGWAGALLAAIAFAFSGFFAARIWAGHIGLLATVAWIPWTMLALAWSVAKDDVWSAIVAGLPYGLAFLAGNPPSFLYLSLLWASYVLYFIFTRAENRWQVLRQAAIMAVVGLGLASLQLVPFLEVGLSSSRVTNADFEFATDYSLPPAHLITLANPRFFGEPVNIGYWSVPTFEELTYYAGLITFIGLALALRKPTRLAWFLMVMMAFGLWLALGRYGALYPILFDLLPPFRLMRAPARATILYLFAATALLGHTMGNWRALPLEERTAALGRLFPPLLAVVTILGAVALTATGAVFIATHPTDTSGRLWHQVGGYASALVIFLVGGGLLWAFLKTRPQQTSRRNTLLAALVLLLIADMWQFGYGLVNLQQMGPDQVWQDAKAVIGETEDRVLPWGMPIFGQNGGMQVGLNSVFGYDSLAPATHIALTSSVPDPRSSAYDILGARYVIAEVPLDEFTAGEGALILMENHGAAWVYQRPNPAPVVRLAFEAEVIADDAAAIAEIHSAGFDPHVTAILDEPPPCEIGPRPAEPEQATIEAYESGYWRIRTQSASPSLLLLAETAHPGWGVSIDGDAAQPLRAYTTVRAVCVPAGEHLIEWSYAPASFKIGGVISLLVLLVVVFAVIRLRPWRPG